MLPGFDLTTFTAAAGAWVVVLVLATIVFAESGLLIGFFLPGDTLLFTAGFLVFAGKLNISIHLLVLIIFIAAVLGDAVGYLFGKKMGPRLFNRPNSRLFKQESIQKAERFYKKYGALTIIIARFTPMIRTFAPIMAGVGNMGYKRFAAYNVIGALLWAGGITYLGYFAGDALKRMGIHVEALLLPIIVAVVVLSLLSPALHSLSDKQKRQTMWEGTKRQINILFRKK